METQNIVNSTSQWASSLAEQFASISPLEVVVALLSGFAVGLIIAFVYKTCFRGVLYSPNFALTLVMLTLITTPVTMCIKSDIALSMGMVGALSIVRFRTAVKDPMDTAYMFWALTMGILLGAGLYLIALVVVLGIGAAMFALTFMQFSKPNGYLLVVHYDGSTETEKDISHKLPPKHRLRSKTVTRTTAEMTVEVRLNQGHKQDIVAGMLGIQGVYDATLVACQTEAGA